MLKRLFQPPSIDWHNKFKLQAKSTNNEMFKEYFLVDLPEPNTKISQVEFLAIDFETTGLNPKQNAIVSIGVVPFNLNKIYLNKSKYWLIKPRRKLVENSIIINKITHDDILHAPDLKDILDELLALMEGKIIVAHCSLIERDFFKQAILTRFNETIEFPVIDTMDIENRILKNEQRGFFARLNGDSGKSTRLAQTRARYNLPIYPPHHARWDALAAAELLQAQIKTYYDLNAPVRQFWI